jgi:hypothetical protein
MGSINFNNLERDTYKDQNYIYADLYLDLMQEPFEMVIGNRTVKGAGKDIKVAYDLNAIRNSILNLFNTIQGHRFLLPDYGCDLRRFLFEPISEAAAYDIGRTISENLEKWEPRVTLISINIDAYPDRNEYVVAMTLAVPFLQKNEKLQLNGLLNNQGFILT